MRDWIYTTNCDTEKKPETFQASRQALLHAQGLQLLDGSMLKHQGVFNLQTFATDA